MVDATSGGTLIDKTPDEVQHLISTMAENYRQYGYHMDRGAPSVNEVSTYDLAEKLSKLTVFVHQLAAGQMQEMIVCGICSNTGHLTDACPALKEGVMPNVNTVGGFLGQPQYMIPTLISTIRDGETIQTSVIEIKASNQSHNRSPSIGLPRHLHKLCLSRQTQDTTEGLQETRASLQHLGNQTPQLATSISKLKAQAFGKLPFLIKTNPRENMSAITLRSGKEIQPAGPTPKKARIEKNALDDTDSMHNKMGVEGVNNPALILLGMPFMKTAKTRSDVDEGTLSVEFGGEIMKFNISEAMKYPNE
ncbi:UNVERIFIED_CONTAM: hypothetical protein Sangu_2832300, partial [Sesamum angustifolium]